MGRIGYFVGADNAGASGDELLKRDQLAHELMYFSRGNPVVYYGDEQGFTGTGGDQVARQTMFASEVPEYLDDDLLGTTRTHAQDNFETSHPLYTDIAGLAALAKDHPALRNGTHQHRYASDGPGIYAFSRLARGEQREYVVALNNSEQPQTAKIPTYLRNGDFTRIYGSGAEHLTSDGSRLLSVTVPALSTVVYESDKRIARSKAAPSVWLKKPAPAAEANSRMLVSADIGGSSFNEVTFYAKVGKGNYKAVGTDDTRPYRVFHDTSSIQDGKRVGYRAVVRDNAGHQRISVKRSVVVPAPKVTIEAPAEGADVFGKITVRATADPERASHVVKIQRSLNGAAWQTLTTDSSSPVYTYVDDLATIPVGTAIRYRAVLKEPDGTRVVSPVRSVIRTEPAPLVGSVTVAGAVQSEIGCAADWDPACSDSHLTFDTADGLWKGTWTLPAGTYEYKVAIDDSWTVNYGAGGAAGGSNLVLTVPPGGASVTFVWDQVSHVVSHTVN